MAAANEVGLAVVSHACPHMSALLFLRSNYHADHAEASRCLLSPRTCQRAQRHSLTGAVAPGDRRGHRQHLCDEQGRRARGRPGEFPLLLTLLRRARASHQPGQPREGGHAHRQGAERGDAVVGHGRCAASAPLCLPARRQTLPRDGEGGARGARRAVHGRGARLAPRLHIARAAARCSCYHCCRRPPTPFGRCTRRWGCCSSEACGWSSPSSTPRLALSPDGSLVGSVEAVEVSSEKLPQAMPPAAAVARLSPTPSMRHDAASASPTLAQAPICTRTSRRRVRRAASRSWRR